MYDKVNNKWVDSPLLMKLKAEKKSTNDLQQHKHEDWNDNYELYRNKVKTNRLTQRQAVNIPLMKETIKTLLSKIDDRPDVNWKELGGEEDKEIVFQEIWDTQAKEQKLELTDVLDKKNVLLYGISAKKLNPTKEGIEISVLDVYDIGFDPLMSSSNIETARFIINQNIFRSIRDILTDDRYTQEGKEALKVWADSPPGITQSSDNKKEWDKKMERIQAMGVGHKDFPLFAGGDRIVNLTEHYTTIWNKGKWERRVIVYAENTIELADDLLEELTGIDLWPFVIWSEDPETNDIYPDAVADLVRTPNKVLNVWFSQLIENRTLKNFQMHWFLPSQGYTPQTYTPGAGVMLPAPPGDDINKVIKPVEISGLDDTFQAIAALTQIVERGTGATAIEKGEPETGTQTLGEVQILVGKAMERTIGMAKFYRMAWYELCKKWSAMMHANPPKKMSLYKTSREGTVFPKTVYKTDWMGEYEPTIESSSEQEQNDIKSIQRWTIVKQQFPNNPAIQRISAKRMLEVLDISPEEMKEIKQAEEEVQRQNELAMQSTGQPTAQVAPEDNSGVMAEIQSSLNSLAT